jgi:predicted TIM-barrel fold metal-dependent hydrolase
VDELHAGRAFRPHKLGVRAAGERPAGYGRPVIVDAHVHLLPGRLAEKVRSFMDRTLRVGGRHADEYFAYPLDHATVLTSLAGDGVDEVWSLPYAHKPGVAAGLNEASALTAAAFADGPVRVVGGATVHPGDDDPAGLVADAVDRLGLRVLKLHCSVGSFDVDDDRLAGVFGLAAERQLPVVVHLGHAVNGLTEDDEFAAIDRLATAHPAAPIVIAHCGHHASARAMAMLSAHPALHADLTPVASSRVPIDAGDIVRLPDRFLFGSDAPNTPLDVASSLGHIRGLGLPSTAEAAVLGGNARRLVTAVAT